MGVNVYRIEGRTFVEVKDPRIIGVMIACAYAWEELPPEGNEHAVQLIVEHMTVLYGLLVKLGRAPYLNAKRVDQSYPRPLAKRLKPGSPPGRVPGRELRVIQIGSPAAP